MSSKAESAPPQRSPRGKRTRNGDEEADNQGSTKRGGSANAILTLQERNGTIKRWFWTNDTGRLDYSSNTVLHHRWSLRQWIYEAFLPEGFPESVSADYVPYQVFDSIQALASSFTGTLATKAMLHGYGVGNTEATAAGATIQWILKDGSGNVGRVLFAWLQGSNLDANAKTWRFMADILNDIAMTLEICIPSFPHLFLPLVCTGSVLKAIVGAAGGATRAAMTQHQARRDNMADVSSKDGSQETALVMVGMILALVLNPLIGDSQTMTWIFFIAFTCMHLLANYMAVSAVSIDKLNRQRADIVIAHYLRSGMSEALAPNEASKFERILYFETDRTIQLGCSVETALAFSEQNKIEDLALSLSRSSLPYLLLQKEGKFAVLFRHDASPQDVLQSYFEAKLLQASYPTSSIAVHFKHFSALLQSSGWNTATNLLGASQRRVHIKHKDGTPNVRK